MQLVDTRTIVSVFQHPDVARRFRGGEIEVARLKVVRGRGSRCRPQSRVMQVKDRAGLADRSLRRGIHPLYPGAKSAVARREVIEQGAVRRPVRMAAMVGHERDPRLRRESAIE